MTLKKHSITSITTVFLYATFILMNASGLGKNNEYLFIEID